MLMYVEHLQNWVDYGHSLLIFLILALFWLREMGQIWGFWSCSVDFSSLCCPFDCNWSYLGFLGIIWRMCGSKGGSGDIFPMLCVEFCLVFFITMNFSRSIKAHKCCCHQVFKLYHGTDASEECIFKGRFDLETREDSILFHRHCFACQNQFGPRTAISWNSQPYSWNSCWWICRYLYADGTGVLVISVYFSNKLDLCMCFATFGIP